MSKISRVLIANRGEIAVRVIRACKALGLETVAAVSEADKDSMSAKMADRVICIGPPRPLDSYLNMQAVVCAAIGVGADAIHPGYGFLAERPELAAACENNGLVFIGPRAESIRQMGNKIFARKIVKDMGIPVIPGSEKVGKIQEARDLANSLGFPILLKAAAGGGGRGMRIVNQPADLQAAFEAATAEARAAFGDETLYMEHFIPNARHIEVQIIADHFGNVIHLGERDCSLQRRYQKIIEEAPAPSIDDSLRDEIRRAGVAVARNIQYENAGTVEFILDQDKGQFYFLEMNTRIQVEHPVTEMISGIDLVQEQLQVAAQLPISLSQEEVRFDGHSLECRINAELLEEGFRPCPGRITRWIQPEGPGVRVDSHCYPGYFVPPYYDSLLAKVITRGENRLDAIRQMQDALENFIITGVDTTIPFLKLLINQPDFLRGKVNVRWAEGFTRLSEETIA